VLFSVEGYHYFFLEDLYIGKISLRVYNMGLLPDSFFGEILCRDRACPCPNSKADSHTVRQAHRPESSRRKGCPYISYRIFCKIYS
jgi:hypothetical protein